MRLPDIPREVEIEWLLAKGIPEKAMIEPTVIRAANVVPLDGNTFDFDRGGIRCFVFKERDDFVAWSPRRHTLASWRATTFALNENAIWNPASYFVGATLRVHAEPVAWLKAEREGIVIVKPELTYAYLRDARLSFADAGHARRVSGWLRPPKPNGEIFIEVAT
jgi:hypothetical protein